MPTPDFDQLIDRRQTASTRWNRYAGQDVIPLWVADMDFACAPEILAALHAHIDHGVLGYTDVPGSLPQAIEHALARDHDWAIDPQWLVWLPGLVPGLNLVSRAVGAPGDGVITATPIYPPFLASPPRQGRQLIRVPLTEADGGWRWDPDALARAITPTTRLLLLCNPHNPVGRVFSRGELEAIAELACRHDLIVCSDEVHCDLILEPGLRHIPLASLGPEIARRSITLMAASKTYNLPGLGCAFAVVPDAGLRARLLQAAAGLLGPVNTLGYIATEAAYRHGVPWRDALIAYLRGNRDRVAHQLADLDGVRFTPGEATYLAWIDLRARGLGQPARFLEAAGVGLQDGALFGQPGFVRLNFGCPRPLLDRALQRMRQALQPE
jgi:cysteine-S-conjugate beta-lyase